MSSTALAPSNLLPRPEPIRGPDRLRIAHHYREWRAILSQPDLLRRKLAQAPCAPHNRTWEAVLHRLCQAAVTGRHTTSLKHLLAVYPGTPRPGLLLSAAHYAERAMVALILDAGADVHARTAHGNRTILHLAAVNGHAELCQDLVARGCRWSDRDAEGHTAWDLFLPHAERLPEFLDLRAAVSTLMLTEIIVAPALERHRPRL